MDDTGDLIVQQSPYADELAEIRISIQESRDRIARTLEDLQDGVEEKLDWKAWVQKNPWKAVGIAFALGVYTGIR